MQKSANRLQEDNETHLAGQDNSRVSPRLVGQLAGRKTFLHINILARQTETILGVAYVTKLLDLGFKAAIRFEGKLSSAEPT